MMEAWLNIAIAVAVLIILILMWRKGYRKQVRQILLALVTQAEKAWGSGTGPIKFSDVYGRLPVIVTLLFSQSDISDMIEDAVAEMKKLLAV